MPLSPSSFVTFDFAGLSSNLAYITSVAFGYIGTDSIGLLNKRFVAKKPEKMKSIINVRRSSIRWRGRRELITDVRKPEITVMTSLAESYLLITPITLANFVIKPKPATNRPDATASFPLVGCLPQAAWPGKTSLRKVRTLWHCVDDERGALPMIDRGISAFQAIDRCSNILSSLSAGYGQFEQADSLIAKFKEAGGTVREIDV